MIEQTRRNDLGKSVGDRQELAMTADTAGCLSLFIKVIHPLMSAGEDCAFAEEVLDGRGWLELAEILALVGHLC